MGRCRTCRNGSRSRLLYRRNILFKCRLRCMIDNRCSRNLRNNGRFGNSRSSRSLFSSLCCRCCSCLSFFLLTSCSSCRRTSLTLSLLLAFLLNFRKGNQIRILTHGFRTLLFFLEHTVHFFTVSFQNPFGENTLALFACDLVHQTKGILNGACHAVFRHVFRLLQINAAAGSLSCIRRMHCIALRFTNQKNLHSNPPIQIILLYIS